MIKTQTRRSLLSKPVKGLVGVCWFLVANVFKVSVVLSQ